MKRTQQEIVSRINERQDGDFFGFETRDYAEYLDKEHIKPYLKDGVDPEVWQTCEKEPEQQIREYMTFAWEKANGQRGLSASRSIAHMTAWLWLAGEDELATWCDDERNYYYYGKPILERVCDHYGIDWHAYDDGARTNG